MPCSPGAGLRRPSRSQANQCWEARATEDDLGDAADEAEGRVASKAAAADFKQLKILLRMLEDRIAQAAPTVRHFASPPNHSSRIDSSHRQTGDGITHRAEFLFELLRGLNITADTLKDLLARVPSRSPHARLIPPRFSQGIITAAVDQLAGDAAEAGRKTVRTPLLVAGSHLRLNCVESCRVAAPRTIAFTRLVMRCVLRSGARRWARCARYRCVI